MAKAHTPKVTLYTSRAKCILMEKVEPQADFEMEMLADGSRVVCLGGEAAGTVQIITQANGTVTVDRKQPLDNLPTATRELISYAERVSSNSGAQLTTEIDLSALPLMLNLEASSDVH